MEALLPLIIQYSLQYGVPAVISLIDAIKKPSMTWDEIQAAFKVAETPYGLTPNLNTPLTDLGVVVAPTTAPTVTDLPSEFVAHPELVIVTGFAGNGGISICNAAGNCWRIVGGYPVTKTPSVAGGEIWQVGTLRFFVTAAALAAMK